MHEGVNAVVAGKRSQSPLGDNEPLRRERIEFILAGARGLRRHDVDAWRKRADGLCDGKGGGDIGVKTLLDGHLAFPDPRAARFGEVIEIVTVEIALEIASDHRLQQVAIADAIDFEGNRSGIDADDWNAALAGARQHIGFGGEAHHRLAVTHVDAEVRGFRQRFIHLRGNAGAQGDGVALTMLEALDAKLPLLHGESGFVLASDGNVGREIGTLAGQVLGELEAGMRRGCVRIHRVVEEPETVILAQALVLLTHLRDLAELE